MIFNKFYSNIQRIMESFKISIFVIRFNPDRPVHRNSHPPRRLFMMRLNNKIRKTFNYLIFKVFSSNILLIHCFGSPSSVNRNYIFLWFSKCSLESKGNTIDTWLVSLFSRLFIRDYFYDFNQLINEYKFQLFSRLLHRIHVENSV